MAFTQEPIPEDFKKIFDFSIFHNELGRPFELPNWEGQRWTIDKDRDAFLIPTGGGAGAHLGCPRSDWFGFWWKGDVVHFHADQVYSEDGCVFTWANGFLELPVNLEARRTEIFTLIQEALRCRYSTIGSQGAYTVHVKLN